MIEHLPTKAQARATAQVHVEHAREI